MPTLTANPRVLVVDDEADNRSVVQMILEHHDMLVTTAHDGLAALAYLQAEDAVPDLILLDLMMPRVDGWSVLAQVRALPHCAQVPVVALTALAMPEDRERVMAAGFDGYITKPLDVRTLVTKLRAFLPQPHDT
ncbi:MAG: response regulator [Anaerolineales bacterium]